MRPLGGRAMLVWCPGHGPKPERLVILPGRNSLTSVQWRRFRQLRRLQRRVMRWAVNERVR